MIQLAAGEARADILPSAGAGGAGMWLGERPVLRPWSGVEAHGPFALGMNLLAPFSNRVAGSFWQDDVVYQLEPNVAGEPYAIHGDAFQREWVVTESRPDSCTLELPNGSCGPYRYRAQVHYRLSESEFEARLTMTNLGAVALPFGGGFHPWFPRSSQTRIRFGAAGYWPQNAQHLPTTSKAQPLSASVDFTEFRSLPEGWINAGFEGWNGLALIEQGPEAVSLRVSSNEPHTAILYSPSADADFFCFEPVTHPVNAHNLPGRPGLVTLASGEQLSIGMTIAWS